MAQEALGLALLADTHHLILVELVLKGKIGDCTTATLWKVLPPKEWMLQGGK
jgi:hypothetical protein